jgi:hypothetical protein
VKNISDTGGSIMSQWHGGKGDAPRKQQDQKAYDEGWDRIFRKRPKEEPIKEEPLKEKDND